MAGSRAPRPPRAASADLASGGHDFFAAIRRRRARLDQRHGRHARRGEPALDQAVAELPLKGLRMISFAECRTSACLLLDAGSFHEWIRPPSG
jgi:hypothetical protein